MLNLSMRSWALLGEQRSHQPTGSASVANKPIGMAAAGGHQAAAPRGERRPAEATREHASPGSSTAARLHLGCSASRTGSDGRGATTGPSTSLSPATRRAPSSSAPLPPAACVVGVRSGGPWLAGVMLGNRCRPPPRS